ncbi:unnamed protein product [Tuwongella immobilis]|uniref:Uncharacterized protein n=1 Tax=Tuwongella immobilis TaxID=692036 RepID=A0A6C2YUJ7_9BACT|nr:unnamed protein product [Tuwongella immobilis]VTS07411.1 unnamed protein product [Tuwongella immobilis]
MTRSFTKSLTTRTKKTINSLISFFVTSPTAVSGIIVWIKTCGEGHSSQVGLWWNRCKGGRRRSTRSANAFRSERPRGAKVAAESGVVVPASIRASRGLVDVATPPPAPRAAMPRPETESQTTRLNNYGCRTSTTIDADIVVGQKFGKLKQVNIQSQEPYWKIGFGSLEIPYKMGMPRPAQQKLCSLEMRLQQQRCDSTTTEHCHRGQLKRCSRHWKSNTEKYLKSGNSNFLPRNRLHKCSIIN